MDPNGARARFESLFAAHYGDLMRYATRRVGVDAASDVIRGRDRRERLVQHVRASVLPVDDPQLPLVAR